MTESSKAVFLSYASQDAEAARHIADALRSAGVEVWFDQSELRGGDAWDHRIRREIRDCALFIPIISRNTQSRAEGYFRLEWHLADQRTQLRAKSRAFLVPVCVDDTTDINAEVPDSFSAVQWTRLPAGDTPPAFVERVSRLLSPDQIILPVSAHAAADPAPSGTAAQNKPASNAGRTWRTKPALLLIAATVVITTGYFAVDRFVLSKRVAQMGPASTAGAQSVAPARGAISEKSIAVLPFVDMSEKHDQEYFSDGLAEELLNLLSKVPGLQVIARTSSFSFKGKSEDIPTIAKKLSVANILEGSIRKSGRRLRITTQLIRADNGVHIWSETYDRDLEDVFKVQDEIARVVVDKLRIALLSDVPSASTKTANSEAHILYLQGEYFKDREIGADFDKAIDCYQRALALDPTYAPAWAGLSTVYVRKIANGYTAVEQGVTRAREAASNAIQLDPTIGEAYATLGTVQMMADHGWPQAAATLAKGRALDPTNSQLLMVSAVHSFAVGREKEAMKFFQQVLERDPLNLLVRRYYARALFQADRLADAELAIRQVLDMSPSYPAAQYELGRILLAQGQIAPAVAAFEAESSPAWRLFGLPLGYYAQGRTREADAALAALVANSAGAEFQVAETYAFRGDADKAFEWLNAADVKRDPGVMWLRGDPLLKTLVGDPRYIAMVRKLKLVQ